MTFDYKTSHYTLGENEPECQPQKALSDIVFMVKERIEQALKDEETGFAGTHPRIIISMVVTNILVILLFNSIAINDIPRRLEMVVEILDEIREMTINLWLAMEANGADTKTPH
jgi:hypothetical protein